MSSSSSSSSPFTSLAYYESWLSSPLPRPSRLNVTICGAGNLCHVFCGLLGARKDEFCVRVLSRKASSIRSSMVNDGVTVNHPPPSSLKTVGKVEQVSDDPKDVIPQADFIIITVPSHGRPHLMARICPHISRTRPVFVGVMPGMGGYDYIARQHCKQNKLDKCIIWGVKDVPYMCAWTVPGKSVNLLGPKTNMYFALDQHNDQIATIGKKMIEVLTNIPTIILDSFLVITLTPGNPIMHPSLMYGAYGPYSQWNGKPIAEKPLFYEDVSELSSYFLTKCDEEVQGIKNKIIQSTGIDLEAVWPLRLNLKKVYGDIVGDNRTLMLAMRTNSAYKTIRTPLKEVKIAEEGNKTGYTIDVSHRFFLEDIPYGLVVLADLGRLVGVSTPMIDEILAWAQRLMGKEYIVGGQLKGKDIKESGAPSIWGIHNLKQLADGANKKGKKSKL